MVRLQLLGVSILVALLALAPAPACARVGEGMSGGLASGRLHPILGFSNGFVSEHHVAPRRPPN